MNYNIMEKELVEINQIRNLEYVSFYDVTVPKKMGNITQTIVAPALLIKADGKTINHSVMDKYFVQFVHKVISVYHKEKNMPPIEGAVPSLIPHGVAFDNDNSRRILEDAAFLEEKEVTSFYDNKDGYDNSLIFQTDEIKAIMGIIRYVITDFSRFADINIKLSDNYEGYRNIYKIEGEVNGIFTYILVRYNKISDNDYQVSIMNIGETLRPYVVDIHFMNNRIGIFDSDTNYMDNQITIVGKYQDIEITNEYRIGDDGASYLSYAYRNGKPVVYDAGDLEKVETPSENLVSLDHENQLTWYKLPWNAYIGKTTNVEDIDAATKISTSQIMYLDIMSDSFYKREYYTKELSRDRSLTQNTMKVTIDELNKRTFGFKLDNDHYLVETSYKDAFGDGVYQEKYNGRYFYHIVKTKTLQGITGKKLIPVTKDIVNDKSDLLIEEKIKRIGEKK